MGQQDIASLEHTIAELEQRILARVGKWALTIMGTCVALAIGASTQWFGLLARVDRLEVWREERNQPIEQYYKDREINSERLAKIEARIEEIYRLVQRDDR